MTIISIFFTIDKGLSKKCFLKSIAKMFIIYFQNVLNTDEFISNITPIKNLGTTYYDSILS